MTQTPPTMSLPDALARVERLISYHERSARRDGDSASALCRYELNDGYAEAAATHALNSLALRTLRATLPGLRRHV